MKVTITEIVDPQSTTTVDLGVSDPQMAASPNTDPQILRKLEIRRSIARNPNTPTDLLWQLGIDFPEEILANPIFELLQLERLHLAAEIPHCTLTSLLQCDRVPRAFMDYAVSQQDYSLWLAVAYNPLAPSPLLTTLAHRSRNQDRELIRAVAAHPNAPPQLLAEIIEISSSLAQIVAENHQTPIEVLQKILHNYGQTGESIFTTLVALHPHLNARLLMQMDLAPDETAAKSLWLAKQATTTTDRLVEIAETNWHVLRLAIVRNHQTPTEIVDRLWQQIQLDRSTKSSIAGEDSIAENRLLYDSFVCNPNTSAQLRGDLRKLLTW
jgi:hypothetical protein